MSTGYGYWADGKWCETLFPQRKEWHDGNGWEPIAMNVIQDDQGRWNVEIAVRPGAYIGCILDIQGITPAEAKDLAVKTIKGLQADAVNAQQVQMNPTHTPRNA